MTGRAGGSGRRAVAVEPHPDQNVAAKSFDQRESFAPCQTRGITSRDRPLRQARDDLVDQGKALFDFADANPYAGIDIAGVELPAPRSAASS